MAADEDEIDEENDESSELIAHRKESDLVRDSGIVGRKNHPMLAIAQVRRSRCCTKRCIC